MSAYVVGFAVTTAVMVCEGLFGSSAVWFMFKSVGKRFRIFNFQSYTDTPIFVMVSFMPN